MECPKLRTVRKFIENQGTCFRPRAGLENAGTRRHLIAHWPSPFSTRHELTPTGLLSMWQVWKTNDLMQRELKNETLEIALEYTRRLLKKHPRLGMTPKSAVGDVIIAIGTGHRHPRFPTSLGFLGFFCGATRSVVSHAGDELRNWETRHMPLADHAEDTMNETRSNAHILEISRFARTESGEALSNLEMDVDAFFLSIKDDPQLYRYAVIVRSGEWYSAEARAQRLTIIEKKHHTVHDVYNLDRRLRRRWQAWYRPRGRA